MNKANLILESFTAKPKRIIRFWAKVRRGGPDECWPWIGAKRRDGYGVVKVDGVMLKVHRVAFTLIHGRDIAPELVIDQTCFNKACCSPKHLEEITQAENVRRYHAAQPAVGFCHRGHPIQTGVPCKLCNASNVAAWKEAHPERFRAIQKRYEDKRSAIVKEQARLDRLAQNDQPMPDFVS